MDFVRYKKASTFEVAEEIRKRLLKGGYKEDWKRDELIRDVLDDYAILERQSRKGEKKPNPLFRLTAPLFCLYWVFLFVGMPVKYMFTGSSKYELEGWQMRLMLKWQKVLNF